MRSPAAFAITGCLLYFALLINRAESSWQAELAPDLPVKELNGLHALFVEPASKSSRAKQPYNVKADTRIRDRALKFGLSIGKSGKPLHVQEFSIEGAKHIGNVRPPLPRDKYQVLKDALNGQFQSALEVLKENPEVDMNASELVTSKDYPFESYDVVTEDGYILSLFRIPYGRKNVTTKGPRPAVLLQHGLVASCTDWLVNPANESLGFVLADAGADVWLGNSRGNIYSKRHKTLDPNSHEFWKFSWDEMAKYDLPAVINFILKHTGQKQIYYVGHSQGTTIGFVQFGEDQELASKIKHFIALAPVARVSNTISPLRLLVPVAATLTDFLDVFGHGNFDIPEPILKLLASTVCQKWGAKICENFLFVLCGFNYKSMNSTRMDVYISHTPAGTSTMDILHWAQGIKSGQFQHFDYGKKENLKRYGQETPPLYDPKKVKVPVAIFRGGQDWLADSKDVHWLLPQLNVTHDVYIPFYEHLDLTFGFDAVKHVYDTVVKIVTGD